jgi:lysophospholipase L1-like esterase
MRIGKWLFSNICLVLFLSSVQWRPSQVICEEQNTLSHPESLVPFFERLRLLEKDSLQQVHVLHIGDSHVQGNYFPNKIRRLFYADFGLGSKGLVFPFQVAGTNTPVEISSHSRHKWEVRKNTQPLFSAQMGICGRTIGNNGHSSSLTIRIPNAFPEYRFDEVSVFYTQINKSSYFKLTDSLGQSLQRVSRNETCGAVIDTYHIPSLAQQIGLKCASYSRFQGECDLHGLYFYNSQRKGVTYNVAGVNGSQFRHWAAARWLPSQSTVLQPDLIIVSLGANDASDRLLTTDEFVSHLCHLVENLQKANPHAVFLLTTPADAYFRKKQVNKQVDAIRQAMLLFAEKKKIACWDLYGVMGGENSILTWQKEGLASADLLHFTKAGYELQGELFYKAFISNYTHYVTHRSH